MFTGIIEDLGKVTLNTGISIRVSCALGEMKPGDSISVNGVCLTIARFSVAGAAHTEFMADISEETYKKTNLGELKPGDRVNLERPLKAGGQLGGHFVTGHVQCTGKIKSIKQGNIKGSSLFSITYPGEISRYLVAKGSVAVDGVSLTVVETGMGNSPEKVFTVAVIPQTFNNTTLGLKKINSRVNLEPDIMSKYMEGILESKAAEKEKGKITMELLKDKGF